MLRRSDIDHILRAAASLSGYSRFVMVGTGAVIATAKQIPAVMMTEEVDIYAEDAEDIALVSDLIDGSIGRYSLLHKTFGYYGDGVSPSTAVMPHRHRQTDRLAREGSDLAARSTTLWYCQSGSYRGPAADRTVAQRAASR